MNAIIFDAAENLMVIELDGVRRPIRVLETRTPEQVRVLAIEKARQYGAVDVAGEPIVVEADLSGDDWLASR